MTNELRHFEAKKISPQSNLPKGILNCQAFEKYIYIFFFLILSDSVWFKSKNTNIL